VADRPRRPSVTQAASPESRPPVPFQLPAAGPASTYCTLYHRDPGFADLAEAELRALGGGHAAEPGVWLSTTPIRWASSGYGNGGGRQLAFAPTLEALEERVRALDLASPTFSIAIRCVPRSQKGSMAAKACLGQCIRGLVSYDAPQLRLLLVVSAQGYRLLLESPVAPDEAAWLGAMHKPHNYVVSLPVRIAQAMLNLTLRPGDTMLDAFCGTGTLPLLAAWAGHRAYGSDISAASVTRAAANLAHFGREATLTCVDALVTQQAADCIVSNLPYGIYCHLVPETLRAILRNLGRLAPRVTLVASAPIDDALLDAGYTIDQVIRVEPHRFERLIYVTRAPG
jgi:hypothetical protein